MIARFALAAVLLTAGGVKVLDPVGFADGLAGFRLVPGPLIVPLALGVPLFEILTGVALLGGRFRSAGALAATGLAAAFTVFYAAAWLRGLDVSCSCFGSIEFLRVTPAGGLLRAVLLFAVAAWVTRQEHLRAIRPEGLPRRPIAKGFCL